MFTNKYTKIDINTLTYISYDIYTHTHTRTNGPSIQYVSAQMCDIVHIALHTKSIVRGPEILTCEHESKVNIIPWYHDGHQNPF